MLTRQCFIAQVSSCMSELANRQKTSLRAHCTMATICVATLAACTDVKSSQQQIQNCALQWQALEPSERVFSDSNGQDHMNKQDFYLQCMKRDGFEPNDDVPLCRDHDGEAGVELSECYRHKAN